MYTNFPNTSATWYYTVRATDKAGNQETNTTEVSKLVDISAPVAIESTINSGNAYTNSRTVTATFRATDNNSIRDCWWSNKFTHTTADWNKISGVNTSSYLSAQSVTLGDSGDGNKYMFFKCTDFADQNSGEVYDMITLDTTAPSTPVAVKPTTDVNSSESFTWDWNASTDATSGVDYYKLTLARNSVQYRPDQNIATTVYTDANMTDGTYVATVTAVDKAGNVGSTLTFSNVRVDTSLPGIVSFTPAGNTDTNDATPTYTVTTDGQATRCKFTYTFNGTVYSNIATPNASKVCSYTIGSSILSDSNSVAVNAYVQDKAAQARDDWNGPFTLPTYTIDTTRPTVTITTPTNDSNTNDTTPLVKFSVQDNTTGTKINLSSITVTIGGTSVGFSNSSCTDTNNTGGRSYECEFSSSALADPTNDANLLVIVKDKANNRKASSITFNVDTNNFITVNHLIATRTSGIADNTYANGWQFDFNITLGLTDGNRVRFRLDDWTSGSNTIDVNGTTTRLMYDANIAGVKTTEIYAVSNTYTLSIDVNKLWDTKTSTRYIDANIVLQQKIPSNTVAGQYKTKYFIKSYR